MRVSILAGVLLIASSAGATEWPSSIQTDWSGGPGQLGPVWMLDSLFYECTGIDWDSSGFITLQNSGMADVVQDLSADRSDHAVLNDYPGEGELISSVFYPPIGTDGMIWGNLIWTSDEPAGTSICFQLRASDNIGSMGEWCDTIFTSGTYLGEILSSDIFLIQYKAILLTENPSVTPALHEVEVEGEIPGSVSCGEGAPNLAIEVVSPSSALNITILAPPDRQAWLGIFDITGRVVFDLDIENVSGPVTENVRELPAGIYGIVLRSGDDVCARMAVLLR